MTERKRTRLPPESRRQSIFAAAVDAAERLDYRHMTREDIGEAAGCTPALVSSYFGSMDDIRKMVVEHGCSSGNLLLIGQALAARHPMTRRLDHRIKLAAAKKYLGLSTLSAD